VAMMARDGYTDVRIRLRAAFYGGGGDGGGVYGGYTYI